MHGVTFAGVNGVLLMINAITGGEPWFLIPFAVGAGSVALHAVHAANRRRAACELAAVRFLDDRQVELVRRLQKGRARLRSHGALAAAVSGLLFVINASADGDPWFLIPSAVLGATVAVNAVRLSFRRSALEELLAETGVRWQAIADAGDAAPASASARLRALSQRTAASRQRSR